MQAAIFVDKVIDYELGVATGGGYPGSVLLLGERLSPALDGALFCEMVRARLPAGLRVVRMYENYTAYPGALPEARERVLDSLDVGFGLVHHVGHGFRNTMSVGQGALDNADIDGLVNGNRGSVLYAVNCSSTAFDFNAIGERFLKNPGGGGVAYIGSTRLGFTGDSGDFQNAFYDLVYGQGVVQIGQALALSKLPFLAESVSETPARWLTFSILLLGDPEMSLWRRVPPPLTVTHAAMMTLGSGPFAVQVTGGMGSVAGARIAARKAGDALALARASAAGAAQLDFRPSTLGSFTVTVTHPDYRPRVTNASVVASAAPVIELTGTALDDDASPPSRGNGNGKADAGEAVALRLTLQNRGGSTANGVRAVLRVRGARDLVTVTQPVVTYGNLAPQSQSAGSASYVLDLHPGAPPAFQPVLELAIESGARRWLETFVLPVHSIRVAHDGHSVVDLPPGGNGNGIPEPNERVEIRLQARNDGNAPADGVLATLRVLHSRHPGPASPGDGPRRRRPLRPGARRRSPDRRPAGHQARPDGDHRFAPPRARVERPACAARPRALRSRSAAGGHRSAGRRARDEHHPPVDAAGGPGCCGLRHLSQSPSRRTLHPRESHAHPRLGELRGSPARPAHPLLLPRGGARFLRQREPAIGDRRRDHVSRNGHRMAGRDRTGDERRGPRRGSRPGRRL